MSVRASQLFGRHRVDPLLVGLHCRALGNSRHLRVGAAAVSFPAGLQGGLFIQSRLTGGLDRLFHKGSDLLCGGRQGLPGRLQFRLVGRLIDRSLPVQKLLELLRGIALHRTQHRGGVVIVGLGGPHHGQENRISGQAGTLCLIKGITLPGLSARVGFLIQRKAPILLRPGVKLSFDGLFPVAPLGNVLPPGDVPLRKLYCNSLTTEIAPVIPKVVAVGASPTV